MVVQAFFAGLSGPWLYVVVGACVGLTSVGLPGWFIPGQTLAISGGALASAGRLSLPMMVLAVFVGANVGSALGYALGAFFSSRKPGWKPRGSKGQWWAYSLETLDRHAALAVLTGRWSAALRATVPNAAGVSRVGWVRFLAWNTLACALWAPVVVGVGALVERGAAGAQLGLAFLSVLVLLAVATSLVIGYQRWCGTRLLAAPTPDDPIDTPTFPAPEPPRRGDAHDR